jgi:predicted secreted hydrolase
MLDQAEGPCRVPREATELEVHALLEASESNGSATTGVIYREGPVVAVGTQNGNGFVETMGYAGTLEGRF